MSETLLFDATNDSDLIPEVLWLFIKEHYWVCAFRTGHKTYFWNWLLSCKQPKPVPNPDMYWRRPTYEEANERWVARRNRSDFVELFNKYSMEKYLS